MALVNVLYGDEQFLINEEYKKLISTIKCEEYDITTYDAEMVDVALAVDDANTFPFMSEHKVVVIKNAFFLTSQKTKFEHNIDSLINYVDNPNPSTTLIILVKSEKLDEKRVVTKRLRSNASFKQLTKLSEKELSSWIAKNLDTHGYKITQGAAEELIRRSDADLIQIKNELSKLVMYTEEHKKIELEHIKILVPRTLEQNVFELTNALMEKNAPKAFEIYNDLITAKHEPVQLLSLISNKFREISKLKALVDANYSNDEIAKALNMTSGRIYYAIKNANSFKQKDVTNYIHELADIDYKIKSGLVDRFIAIETFISRI